MRYFLIFVVVAIIALGVSLLVRLGAFKDVEVASSEAGPYRVVLKEHVGAYHKIVPTIEAVERWAVANGEPCVRSFGEYLNDPNTTDEDRLRSNGGCVVDKDWSSQTLPDGLKFRELPKRLYVIARFDGAPSIGPQKVYPKAQQFAASQGFVLDGAVIEMYERLPGQRLRTHYHFPVKKK